MSAVVNTVVDTVVDTVVGDVQGDVLGDATPTDWWYARAYPGSGDAMDAAAAAVVPWVRERVHRLGCDTWHFVRYLDMTGQHLRLRVRCTPDDADVLHRDSTELLALLQGLAAPTPRPDLVGGPAFASLRGAVKVRHDLYAPEIAKYGGPRGLEVAQAVFTSSSDLFAEQRLGELPVVHERAALAVRHLGDVVGQALEPVDQQRFWVSHQQQWGWHARMVLRDQAAVVDRIRAVAAGVAAAPSPPSSVLEALAAHGRRVVAALDEAQAVGASVDRITLLRHLLHMDLNRWGLHPAEELVLGVIASFRKDH
ncbi:MAG: thiopeptide-type bacteriocin biosynthesis protein [Angustibacter sp.]